MNSEQTTCVARGRRAAGGSVASFGVYRAIASQIPASAAEMQTRGRGAAPHARHDADARSSRSVQWPAQSPRLDGSLSDPKTVIDRGAIAPSMQNEPITEAKLAPIDAGAGLPPTIPPGMRAMSVRVNEVVGVAGFVVPGTRVDVMVTFENRDRAATAPARGQQRPGADRRHPLRPGKGERAGGADPDVDVVTLLVTPEDAQRIALAASEGATC